MPSYSLTLTSAQDAAITYRCGLFFATDGVTPLFSGPGDYLNQLVSRQVVMPAQRAQAIDTRAAVPTIPDVLTGTYSSLIYAVTFTTGQAAAMDYWLQLYVDTDGVSPLMAGHADYLNMLIADLLLLPAAQAQASHLSLAVPSTPDTLTGTYTP